MLPSPPRNLGREPAVTPDLTGAVREKLWYTMVTQGATQGLAAGVFSVALTSAIFCLSVPLTGSLGFVASVLALVSIGAWWWYGPLLGGTLAAFTYLFRDAIVGRRTVSIHERWAHNLARNAAAVGLGGALVWFAVMDIRQPGAYGMRLLEVASVSTHEAVKDSAAVYFLVSVVVPGFVAVCAYCVAMYGLCGVVAQLLAWCSRSSAYRVGVHLGQQQGVAGFCLGGYTLLSAALFVCGFYLPSLSNWPDMKVAVVFPGFVLVTVAAAATLAAWAKWFMWEPTPVTQGKADADALGAVVLGLIPVGIGLVVFLMNVPDLNVPREQWWSTGVCCALTALGIPSLAGVVAHKTGDWLMRTPQQS